MGRLGSSFAGFGDADHSPLDGKGNGKVEHETLTAEEIRAQMRVIRRELRNNVQGLVSNASQMFDWKSYVRSFPWTFVAVAAVAGYLLVPRRKIVTLPRETEQSLKSLSEEIRAAVAPPPKPQPSLISTILPVLGGLALRAGTTYLTRMGTSYLHKMLNGTQGMTSPGAGPALRRNPVDSWKAP